MGPSGPPHPPCHPISSFGYPLPSPLGWRHLWMSYFTKICTFEKLTRVHIQNRTYGPQYSYPYTPDCIDCTDCSDCTDSIDCIDCINCIDCIDCIDCIECIDCSDCSDCIVCTDCTDCTGCTDCIACINCTDCIECTGFIDCTAFIYCVRRRRRRRRKCPSEDPRFHRWGPWVKKHFDRHNSHLKGGWDGVYQTLTSFYLIFNFIIFLLLIYFFK